MWVNKWFEDTTALCERHCFTNSEKNYLKFYLTSQKPNIKFELDFKTHKSVFWIGFVKSAFYVFYILYLFFIIKQICVGFVGEKKMTFASCFIKSLEKPECDLSVFVFVI